MEEAKSASFSWLIFSWGSYCKLQYGLGMIRPKESWKGIPICLHTPVRKKPLLWYVRKKPGILKKEKKEICLLGFLWHYLLCMCLSQRPHQDTSWDQIGTNEGRIKCKHLLLNISKLLIKVKHVSRKLDPISIVIKKNYIAFYYYPKSLFSKIVTKTN